MGGEDNNYDLNAATIAPSRYSANTGTIKVSIALGLGVRITMAVTMPTIEIT